VNELEVNLNAGKIRAATYGRGLWESDLFTSSVGIPEANGTQSPRVVPLDLDGHFALVPGDGMAYTGMRVLDAVGRTVLGRQWHAGQREEIDLSANAPGVYLVEITNGRRTWTVRVVR
jgi:hypothetical protein